MYPYCTHSQQDIQSYFDSVSKDAVLASLNKVKPQFSDFLNFLSPAAEDPAVIRQMRRKSRIIKEMNFGKTIKLYAPLYVSNYCINNCVYCGFRSCRSKTSRRRLSIDEALEEAKIIKNFGMDSLLLVSGEDPEGVSVEYYEELVYRLKKLFDYISIEIYPMDFEKYKRLFNAGVHGLTIYQETYQRDLYSKLHLSGPKADYQNRLDALSAGAEAGFYNLGMGVLLGLYDWRIESVSLAAHSLWMRKNYWRSRIQFSFPRLTPAVKGFQAPAPVSTANLEQMMLAFRLFFHEADLFVSTRESKEFRSMIAKNCVSHISAGSQVVPGGYSKQQKAKENNGLGQFTMRDSSSPELVYKELEGQGLEVVFKDWDNIFEK